VASPGSRRGRRRPPSGGRRQPTSGRWAILGAGLALAAVALWLALSWERSPLPPVRSQSRAGASPAPTAGRRPTAKPPRRRAPNLPAGQLALVIDDLGRSLDDVTELDRLDVPLSYSVLPYEVMTREVVARLARERREILCHLPMQPVNGKDPGPGALSEAMDLDALAAATRQALAKVPGAVGANNHMGSGLTTDRAAMGTVLDVLQRQGLFFLDSRTSAESVGYSLARSLGLPAAERDVFLDDDADPAAIRREFNRFLARARERGAAVAIAHPRPSTLEVLREEVPLARKEGFTFVPVSFLLDRSGEPL